MEFIPAFLVGAITLGIVIGMAFNKTLSGLLILVVSVITFAIFSVIVGSIILQLLGYPIPID